MFDKNLTANNKAAIDIELLKIRQFYHILQLSIAYINSQSAKSYSRLIKAIEQINTHENAAMLAKSMLDINTWPNDLQSIAEKLNQSLNTNYRSTENLEQLKLLQSLIEKTFYDGQSMNASRHASKVLKGIYFLSTLAFFSCMIALAVVSPAAALPCFIGLVISGATILSAHIGLKILKNPSKNTYMNNANMVIHICKKQHSPYNHFSMFTYDDAEYTDADLNAELDGPYRGQSSLGI